MQSIVRRDWLQITSNIAIIVGLIIVIYELNQNHHHVRAQLVMDDYNIALSQLSDLMGENPASAIAKARLDPSQLTPEDEIVVTAYLKAMYLKLAVSMYFTEELDIFTFWEEIARAAVQEEFRFPYVRQWWRDFRQIDRGWHAPLDRLIDEAVAEFEQAESDTR